MDQRKLLAIGVIPIEYPTFAMSDMVKQQRCQDIENVRD